MATRLTPRQAETIRDHLLAALKGEVSGTLQVIGAIPADKLDWKSGPKARSPRELAWHLATGRLWFALGIKAKDFSAGSPGEAKPPADLLGLVHAYERSAAKAAGIFRRLSGKDLAAPLAFLDMGQHATVEYIHWCLLHEIHHRGQLTALLRVVGARVPGVYGPSADDEAAA
jgi:uncharacterized damage-inducible protein DinB